MITVNVYSSRAGVNVIVPGTGEYGEGNHWFPAARGDVRAYVARRVREVLAAEQDANTLWRRAGAPRRRDPGAAQHAARYGWRPDDGYGINLGTVDGAPAGEATLTRTYAADGVTITRWEWSRGYRVGDVFGDRGEYRVTVSPEPAG